MTMTDELLDYITGHIDPEPPHLQQLYHDTGTQLLYSHMCSGHLQGRMLKMLVRMMRPQRVLELGTYSGYAAQCLAEGLAEGLADDSCVVDTIEANDEMEQFIVDHLAHSPVRQRINLHIADALQWMRHYDGPAYDLVYIDADKRQYIDYYEQALSLLAPGGFIIADNTLWGDKVVQDNDKKPALTQAIIEFNRHVADDPRVERVIVPIRDGLTLIHKL